MRFGLIPAGTFVMGSPETEPGRATYLGACEAEHAVTLTRGFYLGAQLVTQDQWQTVMGHNPSCFQRSKKKLPVDSVSWDDCQNFVAKLSQRDGNPYRLPTEAEWECACRAGTTTAFSCGDALHCDQANFDGTVPYGNQPLGKLRNKTMPVDSFPPNPWGMYDMHGNLWEWCQDWYAEYPREHVADPHGPNEGTHRVLRGGAWIVNAACCRSAYRYSEVPTIRSFVIGVRVCF